eukprot:UN13590
MLPSYHMCNCLFINLFYYRQENDIEWPCSKESPTGEVSICLTSKATLDYYKFENDCMQTHIFFWAVLVSICAITSGVMYRMIPHHKTHRLPIDDDQNQVMEKEDDLEEP